MVLLANFAFLLQMFHNLEASKHRAVPGLVKHVVKGKQKWTFTRFLFSNTYVSIVILIWFPHSFYCALLILFHATIFHFCSVSAWCDTRHLMYLTCKYLLALALEMKLQTGVAFLFANLICQRSRSALCCPAATPIPDPHFNRGEIQQEV